MSQVENIELQQDPIPKVQNHDSVTNSYNLRDYEILRINNKLGPRLTDNYT